MPCANLLLAMSLATIVAFIVCFLGTFALIRFLTRKKMTVLDYHKEDRRQVPRPGGPALVAGILSGEVLLFLASDSLTVLGLILVTLISAIVGLVDDIFTLGGIAKPALLLLGGVPLVAMQALAPTASIYSHHMYLPLFSVPTNLPLLYPLLVIVSIPVTTNTVNTIDVLNGVVSGFLIIAFIPVVAAMTLRVIVLKSNVLPLYMTFPILAALLAFYYFHRYPSRIFPGDSGALALGGAYGAMAIIGGVEVVAVIAILPAILNSFFFLSSVKRLVEHRELKASPTVLLSDTSIAPSEDPKAPITLMRLLVAAGPMKEDALVRNIFKVVAFCSALAFITAILTWGITIAR